MNDGGRLQRELSKLLDLADETQRRLELIERRILVARVLQSSFVFALATVVFLVLSNSLFFGSLSSTGVISITFLYVALFVATSEFLLVRRQTRARVIERRALRQIVSLLHETEHLISTENNISALERAEFLIRLSRFDIQSEDRSRFR